MTNGNGFDRDAFLTAEVAVAEAKGDFFRRLSQRYNLGDRPSAEVTAYEKAVMLAEVGEMRKRLLEAEMVEDVPDTENAGRDV